MNSSLMNTIIPQGLIPARMPDEKISILYTLLVFNVNVTESMCCENQYTPAV